MDLELRGKVAVICGGTTGIGAAAAFRFLEEGCRVAVCSHSVEKVEAFKRQAEAAGCKASDVISEQADATSASQVEKFADAVEKQFGSIDIWVNCAGGNKHGLLHSLPEETFRYIMDLNLTSTFFGIQAAAKYMMAQRSGVIINLSSLSSKVPVDCRVTYAAAKAGVNMLTVGAASELAPYGIRVNAVAPDIIDTVLSAKAIYEQPDYTMPMIPLHRAGKPEEIGDVIVCMASSRFGYMTGAIVSLDGGKDTVEDPELAWKEMR